ncbi:MAG TPA: hypothetical protein PKZ53_13480, partial [Acidobacteriota bacterium]|nr:hypothetical protein [Acidobacteriota bacterium]
MKNEELRIENEELRMTSILPKIPTCSLVLVPDETKIKGHKGHKGRKGPVRSRFYRSDEEN